MKICKYDELNVGINEKRGDVIFTIEKTILEAIDNNSSAVVCTVVGSNKGFCRVYSLDGSDLMQDLDHFPEYHNKFMEWSLKIWNREVIQ